MSRHASLDFRRPGRPPNTDIDHDVLASFLSSLDAVQDFQGACVDTGAERSVIRKPQAEAYYRWLGKDIDLEPVAAQHVYQFGDGLHRIVGRAPRRIPFAAEFVLSISVDVVDHNVPLLLGTSTMEGHGMYANTIANRMVCEYAGVAAHLVRKLGHVYLEWTDNVL